MSAQFITLELKNYIIYIIESKKHGVKYIGCTSKTTVERMNTHIWACNSGASGVLYPYFRLFGIESFEIRMIEELPGVTKREAELRETYWMSQTACINERRSFVSKEEQRIQNRDRRREYVNSNRDQILEQMRAYSNERVTCDQCGIIHPRGKRSQHLRSRRHLEIVAERSQDSESGSESDESTH